MLSTGDTVVNKRASSLHGYFSVKGEITKQVRERSSSHRLSLSSTHTHIHTHTVCTERDRGIERETER